MANEQHVKWLKEGVAAWNKRREEEPFIPDLEQADLQGLNLVGINFEEADLQDAQLKQADLSWANLETAYMQGADLEKSTMTAANLGNAILQDARLKNANLEMANLEGAILQNAFLQRAKLTGANLNEANLSSADLRYAKLQRANLTEIYLQYADLRCADIEGANLDAAYLSEAIVSTINVNVAKILEPKHELEIVPARIEATNLSAPLNLTEEQLATMIGDTGTVLPEGMKHPEHWPEWNKDGGPIPPLVVKDEPDRSEDTHGPWYHKAKQKLAPITPIADAKWTHTGELYVQSLTPIKSEPRKPLPVPQPEAVQGLKSGLIALSKQLRTQLDASTSQNAAAFIGDARPLFSAIETQLALPDDEIISVIIQVNISALQKLGPSAEALADTEEVIFNAFLDQGDKLLNMLPDLQIINDPYNEELVADADVPEALETLDELDDLVNSQKIIEQIGPKLGGVTRATDGFPWESDKQKIVNKTSMWHQILQKLESPPKAIEGSATYVTALAPLIALIWSLLKILFGGES